MRYILSTNAQGTDGWRTDRAGKATGSRARDVMAKIKSGEAAARRDYRTQLVVERLLGVPADDVFMNDAMRWGVEQEPFARMAYEAQTGNVVQEAGFAYLPNIAAGCSVDGFVESGILEIKCPKSATHIAYLLAKRLPPEYVAQATHNAYITDAEFVDFVSYDSRLPENLQLLVVRIERNELPLKEYEAELMQFLSECDALEQQLRKRAA